jgi:succinate dehydrogenase / fumarate reductase, cytochrome b subunit
MATRERPLSPHLQVYRPMYTMVLSISHRITGIALTVAFLAFAWWLVALAIGPESYDRAASALGSPLGLVVLAGFVLAYWYHFCAGIRHLIWDTGHMLEKPAARRSAVFVLVATVVLTLLTYWAMYALAARAGGAE